MGTTDTGALAEQLAEAVRDHPSVLRLAGGDFDVIATPLPGRRVTGIRVPDADEPVEIAVVLRLDRPLTETAADLRARAAAVAGQRRVDITIADVATDSAADTDAATTDAATIDAGATDATATGSPEPGSDVNSGAGGR